MSGEHVAARLAAYFALILQNGTAARLAFWMPLERSGR